jgi:hypothetical protein
MIRKILFAFAITPMILSSCFVDKVDETLVVKGLRPVYGQPGTSKIISIQEPAVIEQPGKIVYLAPILFINELNKGFHVIDNSNPAKPEKVAFISVPFNKDLAVKGQYIYANNDLDLVSIRYISMDSIQVISRIENAFDGIPLFPSDYRGFFECVDLSKGDVIGWESVTLTNPKCRT